LIFKVSYEPEKYMEKKTLIYSIIIFHFSFFLSIFSMVLLFHFLSSSSSFLFFLCN
jgi:hypothetical protein